MLTIVFLLLTLRLDSLHGSSVLLEVISGDHEDTCGLFPPCRQLGEGTWQILEDCRYYVTCSLQGNGTFLQHNMQCPGDLFYDEEKKKCLEDIPYKCQKFNEDTICNPLCPRVLLSSNGPGLTHQEKSLGCFRLNGTRALNTLPLYQNMNHLYLTPDAGSTYLHSSWIISYQFQNPQSGGVKNNKYYYIACPQDNWDGWEVDTGKGNWVPDESMTTECHFGYEGGEVTTASPTSIPTASTSESPESTTYPVTTKTPGMIYYICCIIVLIVYTYIIDFSNPDNWWLSHQCNCRSVCSLYWCFLSVA